MHGYGKRPSDTCEDRSQQADVSVHGEAVWHNWASIRIVGVLYVVVKRYAMYCSSYI